MAHIIIPTVRSIYLCDYHFGVDKDKDDLYGICNTVAAEAFPYCHAKLCAFAILTNGLGKTPFYFDML